MHKSAPHLFLRAILAIALMIGFYGLALGIVVALVAVPIVEIVQLNRLHLQLAIPCLVSAAAIAWSLIPRHVEFREPGAPIDREKEPALFTLIDEVAEATGQASPQEVYLVPDVNAFVSQRGGFLGLGATRFMGLGLPLFPALTVSELRAVLAHEFGHYAGGDTKLGGILYTTSAAIRRTVASLRSNSEKPSLLQWPFIQYATMFFKLTNAVSREQERSADRRAAEIESPAALADGLRKIHVLYEAFGVYLRDELEPVLRNKLRPPITEGLSRFLGSTQIRPQVAAALEACVTQSRELSAKRDEDEAQYESHPPLHERIDALASLPAGSRPPDERPASALVADWDRLERRLLGDMMEFVPSKLLPWDDVAETSLLPAYRKLVEPLRAEFESRMIGELGRDLTFHAQRVGRAWVELDKADRERLNASDVENMGARIVAFAIATTLAEMGWSAKTGPGEDITFTRDSLTFAPIHEYGSRHRGEISSEEWDRRLAEVGLAEQGIVFPPPVSEPEAEREPKPQV